MNKLLFIGCNHKQMPYLKELKKYPYKIIGTDMNPNAPGKGLCDEFYKIAYDDLEGLVKIGHESKFNSDDKVFTAAAQFANKGAAHFASVFGIEYPIESSIDLCLDKASFYSRFKELDIPIPETKLISNRKRFEELFPSLDVDLQYYLKSDFSKNPNYVYRFKPNNINIDDIFWGRDRYLQNCYILQEEFIGESLRINIYGDRFNVFQFDPMKKLNNVKDELIKVGVINSLLNYIEDQRLEKWLVKFDIILNNENFVVLDVGLDPPFRMVKEALSKGIDFAKYYVDHYLNNNITYPTSLD